MSISPSLQKSSEDSKSSNERRLRIALVEDNPGDQYLFQEALEMSGHQSQITVLDTAAKSLKYFENLARDSDAPLPHVVVLDLHLPDMDSYPILDLIKKSDRIKEIPVIVLSSSDDEREIAKAYEASADFYLVKPAFVVDFSKIVAAVEEACRKTLATQ